MHMSGAGIGEIGHGQGPGAGSAQGSCNPRKFSEKIALHTQRQAEDTAAFREVMMDVTSIRSQVQAERIRETRSTVPYHGGSLPNVNQISRCSLETQYPNYLTQQLLEADEGYRDTPPSPFGRSHRRHFDSAPYLSTHLSPPRGPAWRISSRNWSSCSATEKSKMFHLPLTALNRTNSDSALHTSVRNGHLHGHPKSAQVLNHHTKHSMFAHSVPLIEENVQEETISPKIKKLSYVATSGYETPVVHNFPLPNQQMSSLAVPSALSTSGSLPDLSSLHLPSPLPVGQDSEPHNSADHLSSASTHPNIMSNFNLPSLSTSLQASMSNPLLQSSLSNPNIQSSLSSHSLPSSLSSTSLHLSLSNSSLRSSLSNQSLQSSLSSSSLSNQSIQSSASPCSYSSGIGGSRSCSSSSLAGSPRLPGHAHTAGSRKRTQLSPLIVSGGDSRWQHPKQFSPAVSPTMSSITQGSLLNPNKALKETKPPAYPCSHLLKSAPPMSHQPVRHYFPLEAHQQSIPEMEQWSQDFAISHREHQPQHQQTHQTQSNLFNSQHHIHNQTRQMQQHLQPQSKYQQQLLYHSQTQFAQHQQTVKQPFTQAHVQFQDPQMSEEQYRCTRRWQLPCQQSQYQGHLHQPHQQPLHPAPLPNAQEERWTHVINPQTQGKQPFRSCVQTHEQPKPQSESEGKSILDSREGGKVPSSSSNEGFELNKESYVGLHLTPRQAKALSQQLGVLQKEPLGGGKGSDPNGQTAESSEQPRFKNNLPNQSGSADEMQHFINFPESFSWLDPDTTGLPDLVLEFDLDTFGLDSEAFPSLEDLSYAQK
ncbi:CREB-regulated transcription coactivator 2 isoform X1 [Triplophysa dalaica]|uniref:CREB-regulated transcription coactivator 2 isoform X1 n=1 Tax=Triplophysa dalaica TaxID=1582913 RepID=UPI0024DF8CAA|nr:CREB-regulated transcription coactivator 2 isoform X1 [Triplophysa dalaica]